MIAESTVTPVPTASATIAVRALNTSDIGGNVTPNAPRSAFRPSAAMTPSPSPISAPKSPVSAASARTEANTCRRLAPTRRSSASSRVRCPTVIVNVLKIVNAPTNSEMSAKMSRTW